MFTRETDLQCKIIHYNIYIFFINWRRLARAGAQSDATDRENPWTCSRNSKSTTYPENWPGNSVADDCYLDGSDVARRDNPIPSTRPIYRDQRAEANVHFDCATRERGVEAVFRSCPENWGNRSSCDGDCQGTGDSSVVARDLEIFRILPGQLDAETSNAGPMIRKLQKILKSVE